MEPYKLIIQYPILLVVILLVINYAGSRIYYAAAWNTMLEKMWANIFFPFAFFLFIINGMVTVISLTTWLLTAILRRIIYVLEFIRISLPHPTKIAPIFKTAIDTVVTWDYGGAANEMVINAERQYEDEVKMLKGQIKAAERAVREAEKVSAWWQHQFQIMGELNMTPKQYSSQFNNMQYGGKQSGKQPFKNQGYKQNNQPNNGQHNKSHNKGQQNHQPNQQQNVDIQQLYAQVLQSIHSDDLPVFFDKYQDSYAPLSKNQWKKLKGMWMDEQRNSHGFQNPPYGNFQQGIYNGYDDYEEDEDDDTPFSLNQNPFFGNPSYVDAPVRRNGRQNNKTPQGYQSYR